MLARITRGFMRKNAACVAGLPRAVVGNSLRSACPIRLLHIPPPEDGDDVEKKDRPKWAHRLSKTMVEKMFQDEDGVTVRFTDEEWRNMIHNPGFQDHIQVAQEGPSSGLHADFFKYMVLDDDMEPRVRTAKEVIANYMQGELGMDLRGTSINLGSFNSDEDGEDYYEECDDDEDGEDCYEECDDDDTDDDKNKYDDKKL